MKVIDVTVIGTEPPCPRCDLLARLVEEVTSSEAEVRLAHYAFDDLEAVALGKRLGRKVGTAKHVAKAANITMDWDAVYGLIERNKAAAGPDCRPADMWTPELDSMLEPCQRAADSVGYLMTPVLFVNGEIKHHGSVPSRDELAAYLS